MINDMVKIEEESYTYYVPCYNYERFVMCNSTSNKSEFANIVVNTYTGNMIKCRYDLIEILDGYYGV